MISDRKTNFRMYKICILFICIFNSLWLCTAQSNQNKDNTQLIDLMDIMLDDFLNPRQAAPIKEQNSRVIQDSAISIEPPSTATLPQASSPSMPAHVPLVEDYSYSDSTYQYSTQQTIPSQSVTTPQYSQSQYSQYQYIQPEPVTQPAQQYQYSQAEPVYTQPAQQQYQYTQTTPSYTQQQYQYTQPEPVYTQPAQQQYQYTQTAPANTQPAQPQTQYVQTEPVYTQPAQSAQTQTASSQANEDQDDDEDEYDDDIAEIDDSDLTDVTFTEDMLEEDYFEKVKTLTGNIEYNSYNSKFRTLGLSMMFDYALRQNASIGVLAGGYIDFSKGFKIKGINFSQDIFEAELALFYRHYIMTDSQKAARPYGHGFYLQPELGVAVAFNKTGLIKDQLGLKVSPLGALRMGYRLYIRKSPLYFEPYVRLGYPFIAGGGLAFGWQL